MPQHLGVLEAPAAALAVLPRAVADVTAAGAAPVPASQHLHSRSNKHKNTGGSCSAAAAVTLARQVMKNQVWRQVKLSNKATLHAVGELHTSNHQARSQLAARKQVLTATKPCAAIACCNHCIHGKWLAAAMQAHLINVLAHAYAQAVAAPDAPAWPAIKQPVALTGTAGLHARPLLPAAADATSPGQGNTTSQHALQHQLSCCARCSGAGQW
jgi:hypothetical protein